MQTKRTNMLSGNRFRRACLRGWTGLVMVLTFGVTPAIATQNPTRSTVASGGTVSAQSATHRVSGTIGQIASGRPQSATNTVKEGFWNSLQICDCPHVGDLDTNSVIDILDVIAIVNSAFRGFPSPPGDPFCPSATRADVNCDELLDILDVIAIVNTAFRNLDNRCDPCAL